MARISQDDAALLERRERTARLYLRGMTQREIAAEVGVEQATVSRDLAAIRKLWLASAEQAVAERTADELARLDNLERTYWEAWERSRTDRVRTYTRQRDGSASDEHVEETQQDGNPEFLRGVERCVARRCEILGLVSRTPPAPPSVQVTVVNGIDLEAVTGRRPGLHHAEGRQNLN